MFEKLRVVFTIPELRKKILLTLGLLAVYRVGWQVPLADARPGTNEAAAHASQQGGSGRSAADRRRLQRQPVESGHDLRPGDHAVYFGVDYLSAAWRAFGARLKNCKRKARSAAKRSINTPASPPFSFASSRVGFMSAAIWRAAIGGEPLVNPAIAAGRWFIAIRVAFHRRPDHDRRHGLSDVARRADRRVRHWQRHQLADHGQHHRRHAGRPARSWARTPCSNWAAGGGSQQGIETLLVLVVLFVLIVAGVVLMTQGQRRIPTQSAKHVRGRRVYGGTRQYLPLRVNQAGVMPIIFASSLLLFPQMFFKWLARSYPGSWLLAAAVAIPSCAAPRSRTTVCLSR